MFEDSVFYVGSFFLLLALIRAWRGVVQDLKFGGTHRVDVAIFLTSLACIPLFPEGLMFGVAGRTILLATIPFLLLRLVGHFRDVPRSVGAAAWLVPAIAVLVLVVWPEEARLFARRYGAVYAGLASLAPAVFMAAYGRRLIGVRDRRLLFAAVGTVFLSAGLLYVSAFWPGASWEARVAWKVPLRVFNAAAFVCYYFAFATPRWLINRWRRGEQASYLAQVAEREPEERGWLAAEDLIDGVDRCINGSLTLVARPRTSDSREYIVRASNNRTLVGAVLPVANGLLGKVHDTGMAVLGMASECEPAMARLIPKSGRLVLVAPIIAHGQSWGLVLTVARRGVLFPEDDLSTLAQLGRNAAISFDHAALIVERRERARHVAAVRLRELESRVSLMLDSIKDYAMLVLDQDGTIAAWHAGAREVFGHAREQIARQNGAALFDMTADAFAALLAEASARGVAEREGICRRLDGRTFIGITTIRPLVAEEGASPGFVVVTRDVTDHRQLEERLRQGQKMQAIGQLAGGIAHDFNNLLTAIIGYADWLERDMAGDPRVDQIVEIQRAAGRAADLTRQLLAFSRRSVVQLTSLDLSQLVRDLLPLLRRLIGHHIEIADATSPLVSPVMGDRSQVEQVVLNLVVNARDAMPNGGQVTIRTKDVRFDGDSGSAGIDGSHVLLEVSDTGVGMDAETRRRAFEPFFTTKEVGSGTGLGLATVYGIVQQMGGLIEVESEPQRGATFRVYLPHATEPALAAARQEPRAPVITGRETLLLIEDDDALRKYLAHVLERHGYHVIPVGGAEAALTVTEAEMKAIDLVISDIVMPGMSGPEVVAELNQLRPGLPALYISGQPSERGIAEVGTASPGPLLQKPFSSTELLTKVRQILSVS